MENVIRMTACSILAFHKRSLGISWSEVVRKEFMAAGGLYFLSADPGKEKVLHLVPRSGVICQYDLNEIFFSLILGSYFDFFIGF